MTCFCWLLLEFQCLALVALVVVFISQYPSATSLALFLIIMT